MFMIADDEFVIILLGRKKEERPLGGRRPVSPSPNCVFSPIFLSLFFSRENEEKENFFPQFEKEDQRKDERKKRERKGREIGKKRREREENEIFFRVKYFGDFPLAPSVYSFYRNELL